jgi:phosphate-selective porin OprO/OprP
MMYFRWRKRLTAGAVSLALFFGASFRVAADEPAPPPPPIAPTPSEQVTPPSGGNITISRDELRKLIDEAIKDHDSKRPPTVPALPVSRPAEEGTLLQNPNLKASDDLNKVVNDIISDREKAKAAAEAKKKEEDRAKGYVVGDSMGMTAKWRNGGVWVETVDKAFQFHLGGRLQLDYVFNDFNENISYSRGGLGPYPDGVNIRRARLTAEGTFYETTNFCIEFDFVNSFDTRNGTTAKAPNYPITTDVNTPAPTDLWIEFAKIPLIGNIRVGNQKPGISMEHWESSRFLEFMERSLAFDAFIEEGNNGFSPGITNWNTIGEEELAWYNIGVFKTSRNIFGYNVGDNNWRLAGRGTWVPYWADDGKYLVHLGVGAYYNSLDQGVARFRARPNERSGPSVFLPFLAVAQVNADKEAVFAPEFAINMNRLCIQGEYMSAYLYGVRNIIATPTQSNVKLPPNRSYWAQGGYIEALYFLTGEHREYNKKTASFGRVVPLRNAFYVRGEDGGNIFSRGAWQVGVRYNYLDLNNNGINGGQVNTVTYGLNWFLNPNAKIQWNYDMGYRDVDAPASDRFSSFGMRFAMDF